MSESTTIFERARLQNMPNFLTNTTRENYTVLTNLKWWKEHAECAEYHELQHSCDLDAMSFSRVRTVIAWFRRTVGLVRACDSPRCGVG